MGDPSCRIVVVASTLEKGALLVNKISSLVPKATTKEPVDALKTHLEFPPDSKEPVCHPWSISNRYYTADVHFAIHTVSQVYGAVFSGTPAVIVAWTQGEPYEEYAERVQKALEDHEPEVLMAVRLPQEQSSTQESSDGNVDEDYSALDSTLISYGFEYIDATQTQSTPNREDEEDVPRLPRVIDALSTIMWPSMSTQTPSSQDPYPLPHERQPTLEEIINRDPMAILQALEELNSEFNLGGTSESLDDETALYKDALEVNRWVWGTPVFNLNLDQLGLGQPTPFEPLETPRFPESPLNGCSNSSDEAFGVFRSASDNHKASLGFEDDFAVYLSPPDAPDVDDDAFDGVKVLDDDFSHLRIDPSSSSGRSTPDFNMLHSSDQSHFPHNSPLYRSLGSASDLGHHSDAGDSSTAEHP
ncbi:hypothetical protein FA13DRAFT_1769698 [Coprinellus micaceus]|uniref:Uncharacterized protein n=1 Tax=Coprinellus micaceus TaxID=71717 RepID=A0A4Y7U0W0_COPMI|nr:hypothetical protein FA13DRAFT_1769698 [Coprinellus micaceus]